MMKKGFVSFLCFFSILFSLNSAQSSDYGVEVRSTSSEILEVEPGRIVTGSFLISNNLEREEEFVEQLKLPQGWQEIISDEFPLNLKPAEQRVKVIAFQVPHTSAAGQYQISYSVTSQRDYNITYTDSIKVLVLPLMKSEILVEKKPEVVMAGETYQASFRYFNKGNDTISVKFQIKSNPNFPTELKPKQITLDPGKSQMIMIEVKTDAKLKKRIKNFLEIEVEIEKSKEETVSTRKFISVEVIPGKSEEFDPYHKLPIKAGLVSVYQDGQDGFQAELSGHGTLDEEGKRSVDFILRGPDVQDLNKLGKRDEYRLSYRFRNLYLHFGDRSYSLSPLTERYSYGRGIEANLRTGKFGWGAFYLKSRWGKPKTEEGGLFIKYQFGEKLEIKGNFLNKRKGSTLYTEGYNQQIYSIQTSTKAHETLNLDLEFGFCDTEQENKFGELAFRMDLHGQFSDQIRYSLEKIYSQPEYFGYYKDVDYTTGSITFPIYRNLRGNLSYRTYENNLDLDSTKGIANQEKSRQAGAFYTFPFGTRLSLKYKELTREDKALPVNFEYEEKVADLGLVHNFGKFSLSSHIERGEFKDKLLAQKNDNLQRYSLYASLRPSRGQSYTFFTRIGHNNFTQHPEYTKSAGISARWYFNDNLSFSLNYRKDNYGSEKNLERDDLFSSLTYTLKNKHSLILRAQWSRYQQKRNGELSLFLMYSIPLKMPVGKKKSIGVLKGRVFDQEKSDRPPISKVILTANGKTAVTNQNGEFMFANLEPGNYYLRVEKSSIGLDRVAMRKQPVITEVKGGKTTEIEMGVVTSCRVLGRVAVFAPDSVRNFNDQDTLTISGSAISPPGMKKNFYPQLKSSAQPKKLLETKEVISVSPDTSFMIICYKGSEKREYFSGKEIFLKAGSDGISVSVGNEDKLEEKIKRVVFFPKNEKSRFKLNGKDHSGILEVIFVSKDSSLLALNWLEKEAISVSPNISFVIRCFKGSEKREYYSGKEVFLKANSEGIILSGEGEEILEEKIERVVFVPRDEEFCFSVNGKKHRGILEVLFSYKDSPLLALNWLQEEDYLKSEVPPELKSQSISESEVVNSSALTASSENEFFVGSEEEKLEKNDISEQRGLGNILVEIIDAEEVLQQLTDEKGTFTFADLRSGKWTLKVYDQDLPAHHYLEQNEFQLELKPGEEKEISVKVLPQLRPIQIIDEGKIEQENK